MFEQDLYNQEVYAVPTRPGDLFYNYEIKNWDITPRVYKILAVSAVLNIVALLVIGSTGLLTARGCDSPFVGRVCQVLDTVYVGALIFGTDKEYADVDYTKTELEDADITFVDVTGVTPPLSYPEGYFQLANPEQQFTNVTDPMAGFPGATMIPGIPNNPTIGNPTISGQGLTNTPARIPKANRNAVDGELPKGSPFDPDEDATVAENGKGKANGPLSEKNSNANSPNTNSKNPTIDPNAAKPEEASADKNGIFINKRPLKDKTTETLAQVDAGKIKLDNPFRVVITGTLGLAKDGKTVILKNPKAEPVDKNFPADPAMTKLAQEWVVAVGDAGWYGYLGLMDDKKGVGRKVTITIEQNDTTFLANLRSEQPTPERANTLSTALRNAMTIGAFGAKPDEMTFLESTKTSSDGTFLLLNFEMPKPQVQELIQRKLAETMEKSVKPEGNALVKPSDNTAEKD